MDRNYLKGRLGDRINAVLAAAGYNFGLLLRWLADLLRAIIRDFAGSKYCLNQPSSAFFTADSLVVRFLEMRWVGSAQPETNS